MSMKKIMIKFAFSIAIFLFSAVILLAQIPSVSNGKIIQIENFPSKFVQARNVDIWLPADYNSKKRYPVLYLHDGQMLFDTTHTWNKQEWGVDETIGDLIKKKKIRSCIVVGIWNIEKTRRSDYFPQKAWNYLSKHHQDSIFALKNTNGQPFFNFQVSSDNYLQFIVKELKPYIDSNFSVSKKRADTFVGGSSMGGLISMYAICEYPQIFGGAACLSTHWIGIYTTENNPIPIAFMKYLSKKLPSPNTHKLYFDHGTATLDALYPPFQKMANELLKSKGYTTKNLITREFTGTDHSEKAWRERFFVPIEFLLGIKYQN
jgi:enterochelin esterase-like enzyme